MKRLLFIPFLLIGIASAFAQSAVLQGGPWKPYRAPMYIGQGTGQPVIGDSGPAGGGPPGVGISELGITAQGTGTPPYAGQGSGPYGANVCGYDAPVTNPTGYHYFCLSPNAQGGALIALGYGGGASPLPFNIILNGVTYPFPGGFATIAIGVTGITGGTNGYCLTVNGLVLGQTSCNVTSAITSLTGDVTGTGPGATATTLATVNSGPGSVGSSTAIPVLTTNGKGLVTAQTTAVVVAPAGTLTGTTLASNVVTSSLTSVGALASGSIASGFGTIATGNEISTTANMDAATGFYISATQVLSSTTLGTGVTASSLTSFGNAPTLVSPVLSGTPTGAGSIITINSTNCQLAASCSIAALITVGITSITGGTPNGLFYDAAGFFGNLATGNNGTLVTSSGGVPSISSTLPAAVQGNITTTGTVTSGTWESAFGGTITGTATLSGTLTLSGTDNFTGTFKVGGYAMAFPAAASNLGYQVGAIVNGDCLMASGTAGGFADAGITCGGGGSGSPGGANTTIQYNASSSFGGVSGVTSNGTVMTFGNGALLLAGSSSGAMTLEAPAIASTYVITFPAATDTVDVLGTAQTFTAAKTFTNSDLRLLGSSTGYTTFASLNASGTDYTLSFPAVTSTIAVVGLSQTFTNTQTYSGTLNVSGTFQSGGNAFAFPAAPDTLAGLGTIQTYTAAQTFTNGDLLLKGSSSGAMTLEAPAVASTYVMTFPAATDTVDVLGTAQTFTAAKTFTNGDLLLKGSSSGAMTLEAPAVASTYVMTFPAATDTVATLGVANAFTGNNSFAGTTTWTGSLIAKVRSSGAATITVSATTDYFFCLDPTSNAIAVDLPATPATGATYLIKDCTGKAATNNITVTPASGNIDGAATLVMSTNYQSLAVTYTGSQWSAN